MCFCLNKSEITNRIVLKRFYVVLVTVRSGCVQTMQQQTDLDVEVDDYYAHYETFWGDKQVPSKVGKLLLRTSR